jgi:hypothetical protein
MVVLSVRPILQNERRLAVRIGLSAALLAFGILLFPAALRAQTVTTTLAVGTGQHSISASYSGDTLNAASSGGLYVPMTVNPAS